MKKRTMVFCLCAIVLLLSCCACTPQSEDTSNEAGINGETGTYIVSVGNSGDASFKVDQDLWQGLFFKDKEAPKERTVTILGKEYIGTYQNSSNELMESYTTDYYRTADRFRFGVRADTGEVVSLNVMNGDFFKTEPLLEDKEDPQGYAVARAREVASEYISVDDYAQTVRKKDYDATIDGVTYGYAYYYVTFTRWIDTWETIDYMTIRVTSKGNVISFVIGDKGVVDSFPIDACTPEAVNESINAFLQYMNDTTSYNYEISKIEEQCLALTPDGRYVVYSKIKVTWYEKSISKSMDSLLAVVTEIGTRQE